jgi:hemerythrin
MTLRLDWNETFSVGNEDLDAQHRILFDIANSIPETVSEHQARTCVVRLFKYTREHFLAEEAVMRKMGYPKLPEHIEIHNRLLDQLSEISVKPLDRDEANLAFKQFVFHWIVDHILMSDKDYHRYSLDQRDGATSV